MDQQFGCPGKLRTTHAQGTAPLLAPAPIVWWTNADGEFVEEQPCWRDYTGQTWDEYRGSGWASCLHPDDRPSIMADWASATASGSLYSAQGRIWSAKHNGYRAFQTQGVPIRNERGDIERWLGALTDVQDIIEMKVLLHSAQTDLADSSTALRDSEARSRAYLASRLAVETQLAGNASALKQLHEASARLWREDDLHAWLKEMLRAAIELLTADKGTIQLFDPSRKVLTIAAHQGFGQPFLNVFKEVSAEDTSVCGQALRASQRVIVEDIEANEGYAAFRAVASAAGYRAVQSTPLIGRDGKSLGVLSTYFRNVHRPAPHEFDLLDLYRSEEHHV